jgi:hypothetical protein
MKCGNCEDTIYKDQLRKVVKGKKPNTTMVVHKDHTGCVQSLRRRRHENRV